MSNRRKIRPADVARQDQALASARNYNRHHAKSLTIFVGAIDHDAQCCWCDCPTLHDDPCGGCTEPATITARMLGKDGEQDLSLPLCDRHLDDFARMQQAMIPAHEIFPY